VQDIAAEANVSLHTFNNYFASKQQALAARYANRMGHARLANAILALTG
jgi:AcrR family transcriptional regulator